MESKGNDVFEQTLFLVPTILELQILQDHLPYVLHLELCGFGPVAAGIETMRHICRPEYKEIRQVILVGIGGTFDAEQLPVGNAASFRHVSLWGVGAGPEANLQTPSQLQLPQLIFEDGEVCFETIALEPRSSSRIAGGLLTVTSSSENLQQASRRRQRFPQCLCEDMEGFSVALAARQKSLPVSIVRGISNLAGDRDKTNWKNKQALQAVAELLLETNETNGDRSSY